MKEYTEQADYEGTHSFTDSSVFAILLSHSYTSHAMPWTLYHASALSVNVARPFLITARGVTIGTWIPMPYTFMMTRLSGVKQWVRE
jgi:hypothetical protein